jgi:Zn-dependent protease with chaperone function
MAKIIWIAVLFLGLPAGIYFALNGALKDQESKWYQAVVKDYPIQQQQQLILGAVCYNPAIAAKADLSPVCGPFKNTRHLRTLAVVAAATPVVYSLILLLLSVKCRTDRDLLFRLFRPGVYASIILVAILILLEWLLISGAIYGYAFGELHGDQYFWIVLFGAMAVAGAFFTIKPLFKGFPKASTTVLGVRLEPSEHPKIWNFVRDLAAKAGAKAPDHLIVGFTPNFFATEAEVICASGQFKGETMYLSLPLCRILSPSELSAVILHELAHFKGDDAKFSIHFYPIYRGVIGSIQGVSNASQQVFTMANHIPIAAIKIWLVIAGLSLLPSVYLLSFFLDAFSRAENYISRDREIAADALAARHEGPCAIATVLVKLAAYAHVWSELIQWAKESNRAGVVNYGGEAYEPRLWFSNMSQLFSVLASSNTEPDLLKNLDAVKTPHPTDTHPPLSVRLKALNTSVESIAQEALTVSYDDECKSLFEGLGQLETQISGIEWELEIA